jgi:hypothetical protein
VIVVVHEGKVSKAFPDKACPTTLAGLIVATLVTLVEVRVFIVMQEYRARRIVVTSTNAVLATAAIVTAAMVSLAATVKPAVTVVEVAAAIVFAPVAARFNSRGCRRAVRVT